MRASATAYDDAVKKLKDEFGQPQAIKEALICNLQNLKYTDGKLDSLRPFVDKVESILIQLEKGGEDIEALYIRSAIEQKLPNFILGKVLAAKRTSSHTWSTQKMREQLRDILRDQEDIARIREYNSESRGGDGQSGQQRKRFVKGGQNPAPQQPPTSTLTFNTFGQRYLEDCSLGSIERIGRGARKPQGNIRKTREILP